MHWRRSSKEIKSHQVAAAAAAVAAYERLGKEVVPRGHVPVLVGREEDGGAVERFVVHVRELKNPQVVALLDMGAQEFGSHQPGVLRIPCDADHFRRIIGAISRPR